MMILFLLLLSIPGVFLIFGFLFILLGLLEKTENEVHN